MPQRNRELKNRVREIRSHGSVRGVGRKPHLYSEGGYDGRGKVNYEIRERRKNGIQDTFKDESYKIIGACFEVYKENI